MATGRTILEYHGGTISTDSAGAGTATTDMFNGLVVEFGINYIDAGASTTLTVTEVGGEARDLIPTTGATNTDKTYRKADLPGGEYFPISDREFTVVLASASEQTNAAEFWIRVLQ